MDDVALRRQLEYVQGQVAALQAAVRGLILAHPCPTVAVGVVNQLLEATQASGLASPSTTDGMLLGLAGSPARIVPTAQQLLRATELF